MIDSRKSEDERSQMRIWEGDDLSTILVVQAYEDSPS